MQHLFSKQWMERPFLYVFKTSVPLLFHQFLRCIIWETRLVGEAGCIGRGAHNCRVHADATYGSILVESAQDWNWANKLCSQARLSPWAQHQTNTAFGLQSPQAFSRGCCRWGHLCASLCRADTVMVSSQPTPQVGDRETGVFWEARSGLVVIFSVSNYCMSPSFEEALSTYIFNWRQ